MAAVEEELHDAKSGYSTYCRRDEHAGCKSAQAKCTCICHGRNGQAGPAPFKPAVVTPPNAAVAHKCNECDRTFAGAHGLSVHKARSHKAGAPKPKPAPPAPVAESDELWIVIVVLDEGDEIRLEGVPFGSEVEAVRVSELLTKVGLRCVVSTP